MPADKAADNNDKLDAGGSATIVITNPPAGGNWSQTGGSYVVTFAYSTPTGATNISVVSWVVQDGEQIWPSSAPSMSGGSGSAPYSPSNISTGGVGCQLYVRMSYTVSGTNYAVSDVVAATPQ